MARIVLTGNLQLHTEGVKELALDVNTLRQLLRTLTTRYPGLPADLEDRVAVSIDGTIYPYASLAGIPPHQQVTLLPKLNGG